MVAVPGPHSTNTGPLSTVAGILPVHPRDFVIKGTPPLVSRQPPSPLRIVRSDFSYWTLDSWGTSIEQEKSGFEALQLLDAQWSSLATRQRGGGVLVGRGLGL